MIEVHVFHGMGIYQITPVDPNKLRVIVGNRGEVLMNLDCSIVIGENGGRMGIILVGLKEANIIEQNGPVLIIAGVVKKIFCLFLVLASNQTKVLH